MAKFRNATKARHPELVQQLDPCLQVGLIDVRRAAPERDRSEHAADPRCSRLFKPVADLRVVIVLTGMALTQPGCSNVDSSSPEASSVDDLTIVVEADKSRIVQEEKILGERQRAVEVERIRLENERTELERRLASLSQKDKRQREQVEADKRRLAEEEAKVKERMHAFESERASLETEKTKLLERVAAIGPAKGGLSVAQREELVGRREKDLGKREAQLTEREKEVARLHSDAIKSLEEIQKFLSQVRTNK